MDALSKILGEEVLRVANGIQRMRSEVRLDADERLVSCPARIPPLHKKSSGMDFKQVDSLDIRLGLLMVDHIALTWVSGEVVTKIYWRLQKESPFSNTILITIANDRVGYIVDDAGYLTPSFESTASPLQPGYAEAAIINNLVEMMNQHL